MTVSMEQLVFFLAILVRITGFVYTAPFFSLKNVPQKVKVGLSIGLALFLFGTLPYTPLQYTTTAGFAGIIILEALCGLILGFFANVCYHILAFAGQLMDMEIGFSMVNIFDPVSSVQITITANFYSYAVLLIMFVTNMHYHIIRALFDSFKIIPVGNVVLRPGIYQPMLQFIIDYFIIGFRIVLPIFAALLIVNTILAILAKVAPQMNMFVIGLQLKVLVGLLVLLFVITKIGTVSEFIFSEMLEMMRRAIIYLRP